MSIVLISWLFIVTSFTCAQTAGDDPKWLFPSDEVSLRSAHVGFSTTKDLRLETIYEKKSVTLKEEHSGCRETMYQVQVAGPLMLAAMLGRKARTQSSDAPKKETVLESRGALLLSVDFYARKKDTETDIQLWQDDHEYQPVSKHVNRIATMDCKFSQGGRSPEGPRLVPMDNRYEVGQAFVFRFAPDVVNADWERPFKLVLRRTDGEVEEYELSFGDAFTRQGQRLR